MSVAMDEDKKHDAAMVANNNEGGGMEEDDDSKIFPQRLMEILSDERNQASICWLPHGRAFVIRDRKLFAETVMPRYFSRKAKYSSFTRKLNRWNFVRVSSGPEIGSYYHEFFLRDKPHLAAQMFCKNARTMLAMASAASEANAPATASSTAAAASSSTKPPPSPVAGQPAAATAPSSLPVDVGSSPAVAAAATTPGLGVASIAAAAAASVQQPSPLDAAELTNPLLDALAKETNAIGNSADLKGALLGSVPVNTLQFLERQMQVLQQEQANRLIMEQAVALSLQQQHRPLHSPLSINQHARLLQMRELMEARLRQQKGRLPTNSRASAA